MFEDRIALADHPDTLDRLANEVWHAYAAGVLSDDAAQAAAEAIQERRVSARPKLPAAAKGAPRTSSRRRQRSPDRQASLERRRRLANRALPDALAAKFTTGEQATLAVIGQAVQERGACDLSIGEIAARAGVSHRLAQQAIRTAEGFGLLAVRERRVSAFRNRTNLITVLDPAWRCWLRLGGCKSVHGTQKRIQTPSSNTTRATRGYRPKRLSERRKETAKAAAPSG